MPDIWNDSLLLPPPICTTLHAEYTGVKKLKSVLNNIVNVLMQQSPLHKESALLSRFLYKFDKKFRSDIGYRKFKKVNTALHKYLALNLLKDVQSFYSVLPSSGDEPYLPTRQMLEYILVRLMTFSKIMFRICVCAKQAAIFYMDRLKRGESHWMSLMPYALLSRVWSMSQVLMEHATSCYSNLYTFLSKLDPKGVNFLPCEYELPDNLETWLDLKNIENYGKLNWSVEKYRNCPSLLDDDNADNILDYVKQINEIDAQDEKDALTEVDLSLNSGIIHTEPEEIEEHRRTVDNGKTISREYFRKIIHTEPEENCQMVDKGETVSREYFRKFFSLVTKTSDTEQKHASANVTSKSTLQQFLATEESYRNEGDPRSLTQHLSFMQWQVLKSSLEKLSESLANNRKIHRKFQKIWEEKCLYYA